MKIPLKYQVTEFDCAPTSFINALIFLFEREELPAYLITSIYANTLDRPDRNGNIGHFGTSKKATKELCKTINEYANEKNFNINCFYSNGESTIEDFINCIKESGVILIRIYQTYEHYVLITNIKNKKAYIFDPYYNGKNFKVEDAAINFIMNKPFNYNVVVDLERLFEESKRDFSMGMKNKRESVYIYKTNIGEKND